MSVATIGAQNATLFWVVNETAKLYAILKAKNAFLEHVYCVRRYTVCSIV